MKASQPVMQAEVTIWITTEDQAVSDTERISPGIIASVPVTYKAKWLWSVSNENAISLRWEEVHTIELLTLDRKEIPK